MSSVALAYDCYIYALIAISLNVFKALDSFAFLCFFQDNFASILLLVTDGRIAPTAAAATAIFPSTVAPYRSDAIRHNHRVVEEGHLEYIGEAVSTGAATCSVESSMSVSRCVCARVSTTTTCSRY